MLLSLVACQQAGMALEPSPHVPTSVVVTFDARRDGPSWVRVESDDAPPRVVPATRDDRTATATVVGLRADTRYHFVGVVDGVDRVTASLRTEPAPAGLTFALEETSTSLGDGYVLMSIEGEWNGIVAVDAGGVPVWWAEAEEGWVAASPRPTRDGRGVLFLENDEARLEQDQRRVRVELDGSARTELPLRLGHHVVAELDAGRFAWPAWDIRTVPWASGDPAPVLSDRVLIGSGASPATEVLSFFDDRGPAYVPCGHGLKPDERLGEDVFEWTHVNSLVWLEEPGTFILVARLLDALMEIDASSGEVLWQAGGRDATRSFAAPFSAFSHGHLSDAWDGGALMFDNGGHDRSSSRVLEYRWDDATSAIDTTWEYAEPDGLLVRFMGDARRLPSDNVLVSWSTVGRIDEVTRDRDVVWSLEVEEPPDSLVGRIWFMASMQPEE